nr:MAG TPA: hypothetical protein [Caudoviricetes sp.]
MDNSKTICDTLLHVVHQSISSILIAFVYDITVIR